MIEWSEVNWIIARVLIEERRNDDEYKKKKLDSFISVVSLELNLDTEFDEI